MVNEVASLSESRRSIESTPSLHARLSCLVLYRQVILSHETDAGTVMTTGWIRDDRIKIGLRLTLKHDPETIRTVVDVQDVGLETPPAKDWKVGGLL